MLGPPATQCLWDRHIVRRVGERHGGLLAVHQAGVIRRPGVVAKKAMPIAESPEVALSAYGARGDLRKVVGGIALGVHQIGEQAVDFSRIKAG